MISKRFAWTLRLTVLVVATLTCQLASPRMLACSCAGTQPGEEKKFAALVFVGRAVEVHADTNAVMAGEQSVTWEVLQSWSRNTPRTVTTETGGGCGFSAVQGEIYLIFAHRSNEDSPLYVSMCSNSQYYRCAAYALKQLGRVRTKHEPIPDSVQKSKAIQRCNCLERIDPREERQKSEAVFVGRALAVERTDMPDVARVTWEVLESWTRGTPHRVDVLMPDDKTTGCGDFNGSLVAGYFRRTVRTAVGRIALVYARRLESGELYTPSCTNTRPVACPGEIPPELGPPLSVYEEPPKPGTNEFPLDCSLDCVNVTGPLFGLQGFANQHLPRRTFLRDVSFIEWNDGTLHDVRFSYACDEGAEHLCTPERETELRTLLQAARFNPAKVDEHPVAVEFKVEGFRPYPP